MRSAALVVLPVLVPRGANVGLRRGRKLGGIGHRDVDVLWRQGVMGRPRETIGVRVFGSRKQLDSNPCFAQRYCESFGIPVR